MALCTLAEVKLQLDKTTTADDVELQSYVDATSAWIERQYGPFLAASGPSWAASGGGRAVLLPEKPTTITSVVENGNTLTTDEYFTDLVSGIVFRGSTVWPITWLPGIQNIVVTYTIGGTIGADVNLAARIIVQHLWDTQNGGVGLPALSDEPTTYVAGFGYAIPNRAKGLLEGLVTPGFA